jgi:hypothetical protein
MTANRMKPVLVAAALAAALSSVASAGDRYGDRWDRDHRHRVENSRIDRQGDGRRNRSAEIDRRENSDGSITHVRRPGNFYGGTTEAYSIRGVGNYFLRDYMPASATGRVVLAPKAKIIDVEAEMDGNAFASRACSFEAGVCVIRGGN